MPKKKKKSNDHDITLRLGLFAAIVFVVTIALVFVLMTIGKFEAEPRPTPEMNQEKPSTIVGDGGITKNTCESAGGYWVECGNPCHGEDTEVCAQVCEPQCLCAGSNDWQCPADFHCTDFAKLASDEEEIGVCRPGEAPEDESEDVGEEITEPIREAPEGMLCDDLNFICVDASAENRLLSNPFEVSGSGIAFENTINWQLIDGEGNVLNEGWVTADAPDVGQPGDFTIRDFILIPPETGEGTLKVLEYSAKDGSPIHVVELPVRLPTRTMTSRIFLPVEGSLDCSDVEAVDITVGHSVLPIETSLRTLLSHLIDENESSAIPRGARLESVAVSNGTARVVFSPEFEPGGGSCAVQAVRAQIEQTLRRFSTVQNVEISVTGKTAEETLQP